MNPSVSAGPGMDLGKVWKDPGSLIPCIVIVEQCNRLDLNGVGKRIWEHPGS